MSNDIAPFDEMGINGYATDTMIVAFHGDPEVDLKCVIALLDIQERRWLLHFSDKERLERIIESLQRHLDYMRGEHNGEDTGPASRFRLSD